MNADRGWKPLPQNIVTYLRDTTLEAVSKPSIGSKIKVGRDVQTQEYYEYFERPNAEFGAKDFF